MKINNYYQGKQEKKAELGDETRGILNYAGNANTQVSPRSCRVAEKSDPIGSREPNYAVFQQNPIVAQAELDAPMDPDAINSQA